MLHNVDSIQDMIGTPKLSGVTDKGYQLLLSQAFMKEAEVSRPWVAIGFDEWVRAARWWLLKAQSTLYTVSDAKVLPAQAFTDLLKASFILVDIFPGHPQRRFWTSEYIQVEILAEDLKRELESIDRLGYRKPDLSLVQTSDLRIWSDALPAVVVQPKPRSDNSSAGAAWQTSTEEVLFRGFGSYMPRNDQSKKEDSVILILATHDASHARIVAQNQRGRDLLSFDILFGAIMNAVTKDGEKTRGIGMSKVKGYIPIPEELHLRFSNSLLTFSTDGEVDEFTIILTAIILHQELEGLPKTMTSLQAFVLLVAMARGNRSLLVRYLDLCQQLPENHLETCKGDPGPYHFAITASKLVLEKERTGHSPELDALPPLIVRGESDIRYSEKTYLVWCWLLVTLNWPIYLGANWEPFLDIMYRSQNHDSGGKIIEFAFDALPRLAVGYCAPSTVALLGRYADHPNRSPWCDFRWRSRSLLRDIPKTPDQSRFSKPPKKFRDLVFLALVADNVAALHYFLDRGELLLEPCLFSLQLAGYKGENQQVFELVRDPRIANIFLTLLIFSEKAEQLLLQHYSLDNRLYSSALLNTIVNEAFATWFVPNGWFETSEREGLSTRLSVWLFRYDKQSSYHFQWFSGKRLTRFKESIKIMLKYGPTLNETNWT